jgi:SAM-dependent methyltransferase
MSGPDRPFFDAIAGRYERAYAPPAEASRRRMARVIARLPPAPARLLDLGVGTGRELSSLQDAGYAPTGVDASAPMLERCARRARPVPLVLADFWGSALPLAGGTFECAVALHGTLAHPPEEGAPARLARELARVLVPGGLLVAEVPSLAWLDALAEAPGRSDLLARVTGRRTCVLEDTIVGARIEARVLDVDEWRAAFGAGWRVEVEAAEPYEWLLVARRLGGPASTAR